MKIHFQLTELILIDTGFYNVFRPPVAILREYSYSSSLYNDYFTIYCSQSYNVIRLIYITCVSLLPEDGCR
jgi:hypothetical protein